MRAMRLFCLVLLRGRADLQPDDAAFTLHRLQTGLGRHRDAHVRSEVFRRTPHRLAHNQAALHDRRPSRDSGSAGYSLPSRLSRLCRPGDSSSVVSPADRSHDERVSAVLADASPSGHLATSAVAEAVAEHPPAERQRRADHRNRFIGLDREFTELSGEGSASASLAVHLWLHPRSGWVMISHQTFRRISTADVELLRRPQQCGAT